jgi:HK97 family phage portal protein
VKSLIGGILNRAPAYLGSVSFTIPWIGKTGAEAQMRQMGAVGTLFAIVNRTSTATAQATWRLYRKARSGKPEDRTEVTSHLALDIWNQPNPFMSGTEFREAIQQHIDLTGEWWWLISRSEIAREIPLELWPMRPDRIAPVPNPRKFISGYVYTGPLGEKIPLQLDEVEFCKMPNPLDPYRGMGPVQAIMTDLDSSRYTSEWNRQFFLNSAEPNGVIEVDHNMDDKEWLTFTNRWREQHQGVANAHRVAVLERAKWKDRQFTMRDMQFEQLRNVTREVIREAFAFPKPMLGAVDDVNRANADAGETVFIKWLVITRLRRMRTRLNTNFLPMFGDTARGLEFDYDDPVPPDREADDRQRTSQSQFVKDLTEVGYDPASVLTAAGLPAIKFIGKPDPPDPGGVSEQTPTDRG